MRGTASVIARQFPEAAPRRVTKAQGGLSGLVFVETSRSLCLGKHAKSVPKFNWLGRALASAMRSYVLHEQRQMRHQSSGAVASRTA